MVMQYEQAGMPIDNLASPGVRLVAYIIDFLIVFALFVVAILAGFASFGFDAGFAGLLPLIAVYLIVLVVQMVLLATRGQTIGKIVMSIHIVDIVTGAHPGWARLILLRVIVHSILMGIPFVGGIYFLVDSLFIFRADRRAIHDMIAGTQVDKIVG